MGDGDSGDGNVLPSIAPYNQNNSANDKFDLKLLTEYLTKSVGKDDAIDLQYYISAYYELHSFFEQIGTVFSFVAKDVKSKLELLQEFLVSNNAEEYKTIQSMIAFEKNNNLLERKDRPSGSRTLLRLHRALNFVTEFLDQLSKLEDNDSTVSISQSSYKITLAQYHSWIIQKSALLAMYTLPTKQALVIKTCKQELETAKTMMASIVELARRIYDITEDIYRENDLLNLP